jgi:hypothetical protein
MGRNHGAAVHSELPPEEQKLLAGVEPRITRALWIIGASGTLALGLWRGPGWAASFAVGAVLSGLSFAWMKTAVHSVAEAAVRTAEGTSEGRPQRARGVAARFVLRYALIGAAGYAIYRSSALSMTAFFFGLFAALGAILIEMAYETIVAFRNR